MFQLTCSEPLSTLQAFLMHGSNYLIDIPSLESVTGDCKYDNIVVLEIRIKEKPLLP